MDPTNQRKTDHVRIAAEEEFADRRKGYFEDIRLWHRALPEINLADVNPTVDMLGRTLSFPLLISSMTGGDDEVLRTVNRNLALAAEATGVAMGVGSQRVMFTHPDSRPSFMLREYAPNALLCANLGAVQFNYGFSLHHCEEAIELIDADALYLHLNPLQEAVQPEGDTKFAHLAEHLGDIAQALDVPVIVKEVGAGLSPMDVSRLLDAGIHYFDVAGAGGTSWSRIEHARASDKRSRLGLTFQDWGIPTPVALRAMQPFMDRATIIASGGIRSGIDMVKAMLLGASLCGIARPFLQPAMESPERVIALIEALKQEFVTAMFLLGIPDALDLIGRRECIIQE
ncbi:MAG: type 2 isopentenyl-diphosphate Delta-isomerase [Spartobacteria bacterium]|nr:type 2 isopentenyl-diphosphate Delta-isomerase [Spartobacteria bacterium]